MKRIFTYGILGLILSALLMSSTAFAQKGDDIVRTENGQIIVRFDRKNTAEFKNLLDYFGLNEDSLFNHSNIGYQLTRDGWKLQHIDKNVAEISKPLSADSKNIDWGKQPIYIEGHAPAAGTPGYPAPVKYGLNNFKGRPTVFENKNDETVFLLHGYQNANKVFLSGNFNQWSTLSTPMKKTDSGWVAIVHLIPGKYLYKFIVDGNWIYDPNNNLKEQDGYGSYNSAYLHHNYTFRLAGYQDAKKVILTGSFNNWNEKELVMHKANGGWELNLYLSEGTHSYKFIVDGEWILDPANKVVRPDGMGHANSFLSLGDTTYFKLRGYTDARLVVLTGSFNGWNTAELEMKKTSTGWTIPYVVASGNYEYKFIVDGKWITDPDNPYTVGDADHRNSVIAINPNYFFTLKKYPNAKEVLLSGSFNGWAEPGYTMIKKGGVWTMPLYLPAGKYTYKFVVDGKWILDPDNAQMEDNEFHNGNSVLWIDPEKQYLER